MLNIDDELHNRIKKLSYEIIVDIKGKDIIRSPYFYEIGDLKFCIIEIDNIYNISIFDTNSSAIVRSSITFINADILYIAFINMLGNINRLIVDTNTYK